MPRGTTTAARRGRGRGGSTRGRGRGGRSTTATTTTTLKRSSRGRRFGRGGSNRRTPKADNAAESNKAKEEKSVADIDVNKDAGEFFRTNASFDQHYDAQVTNRDRYAATLLGFDHYAIEVMGNAKARSLAAAIARHDHDLVAYFLEHNAHYGFVDVLKAVAILDSGREKRAIEARIARIAGKTGSVVKAKKLGAWRNDVNNLEKMRPRVGSFSGATQRLIRRWVRRFGERELEFFALNMPTENWRKLANVVHLHPVKDFPSAPWFLPFCYGQEVTQNPKVEKCRHLNADNVNELVAEFDLPYSTLKQHAKHLNEASKRLIAERQDKLDTVLWYYEDLRCPGVDDVCRARLERGERVQLGYGKLMERLLMFKGGPRADQSLSLYDLLVPIAEADLRRFKSTVPAPVAILGDASSSMDVAIRTATIISSLLTAICNAKLTFFNSKDFAPSSHPTDVRGVLELACNTRASGSTAPAASLVPFYDAKELVRTFIIVTDEEENTNAHTTSDGKDWRFKELFMEYRRTVYPAALIFVSFLHDQHAEGQMYRDFVRDNVPDVRQFKFNRQRPDLTKLDTILGEICSKSSETFGGYVEEAESEIKKLGLVGAAKKLKNGGGGAGDGKAGDEVVGGPRSPDVPMVMSPAASVIAPLVDDEKPVVY